MLQRFSDVERQEAQELHTDTLARLPTGEVPEANLDEVVRDAASMCSGSRLGVPMTALTIFGTKRGVRYPPKSPTRC